MTEKVNPPALTPKETKPVKKWTIEDARRLVKKVPHDSDPDAMLIELGKIMNEVAEAKGDSKDKSIDKLHNLYPKIVSALSLETHARVGDVGGKALGPLAVEVSRQLIIDYDCKTTAEITLAEVAASAYIRILRYSTALSNAQEMGTVTPELNKYMSTMSVEVDRANRQYFTAINMLKTYKQPSVNVTFNAKTAFVAQNQNVNASPTGKVEEQTNEPQ